MKHYATQILIVGGGPAGLSTAVTLARGGYSCLVIERGAFAQGVAGWPYYMKLFSTAELVELCGYPLTIPEEKPSRQQYLRYLARFAADFKIDVRVHHALMALEGSDGRFKARGRTREGENFEVSCEKLVLATGAYDHPNMLGAPGEDLPHVSHYYTEANDYVGLKTVIVGGRHSAAETALELARAGVDVTLVHRGANCDNLKYWIAPDLANRIKEGKIKARMSSQIARIRVGELDLVPCGDEAESLDKETIPADAVLALTGYHPDPGFLTKLGVAVDAEKKQPIFDANSFESTRAGVYLVGVMLAGNISGAIFIENSRFHGAKVLEHLQRQARGSSS